MAADLSEFETRLSFVANEMETVLRGALWEPVGPQKQVIEAMWYAALDGGKRLRPFLMIESARLLGLDVEKNGGIWLAAASLECVHVYSLIHDDLPCMDNDDLRRGKPTVHRKYDEAIAVLAGDALLTLAFQMLVDPIIHEDPNTRILLVANLAAASGAHGMIGGQVIDINIEHDTTDERLIRQMQSLKTGALIDYATYAGAELAGAGSDDMMNLSRYAKALGLAFQIRDDILDAEGDAAVMGKAAQKDAGLGKATFVSIHGLVGAKKMALELGQEAKSALSGYGDKAAALIGAVDFVLERKK